MVFQLIRFRTLAPTALAALALSPLTSADVVTTTDGEKLEGKVRSEEYDGVSIKRGEVTPWDKVASIEYDEEPEYLRAVGLFHAGEFEPAVQAFAQVIKDSERMVIDQNSMFHMARALQALGRPDEALTAYAGLLDKFPKSRYLYEAGQGVADCWLAKGDVAVAVAKVQEWCAKAAANVGGFKAETGILRGRVLLAQGDTNAALQAYQDARSAVGAVKPLLQRAELGTAVCQQRLGKRSEADVIYHGLIDAGAEEPVLAAAWNGLADSTKADGIAAKDENKLLDALYQYMRGVVQYTPAPGESTETYEHSLAGTVECFQKLAEVSTSAALKKEYEARARMRAEQLAAF